MGLASLISKIPKFDFQISMACLKSICFDTIPLCLKRTKAQRAFQLGFEQRKEVNNQRIPQAESTASLSLHRGIQCIQKAPYCFDLRLQYKNKCNAFSFMLGLA